MYSLTLVRHAKSSWDDPMLEDFQRPLNDRGRRDAPIIASRYARIISPVSPQLVSSPALRAKSTALIFADVLGLQSESIRFEPGIYEATTSELLTIIRGFDDSVSEIALFGHNPGLSDLCHTLGRCSFDEMPTCALARFEFDVEHWSDITRGRGRLLAYTFPKERQ